MKIIFGSIITNAAGSVGGQFIKRERNGHSLNNKPSRGSLAVLQSNKQLGYLSRIFQYWSVMPALDRLFWGNTAKLYQFPDKFGNNKFLTGRQFFNKMQSQLLPASREWIDPANWSTAVPEGQCVYSGSSVAASELFIDIEDWVGSGYILGRYDRLANTSVEPYFINSAVITPWEPVGDTTHNVFKGLEDKYGRIVVGQYYQASFIFMSVTGFVANPQIITFVMEA